VAANAASSLPHTVWSRRIDGCLAWLEDAASWIWVVLLLVIVVNVLARYVFGEGRIEFEELQWHLYAVGFLVGVATGIAADAHVRVDVLRERLPPRIRAWIELYGLLLLLLPFAAFVLFYSVPFVSLSFASDEVSVSAGGLPYRWAIKGVLTAGFALIALAAISRLLRVCALLFGTPAPLGEHGSPPGPGAARESGER
jgi:TRAP-type mannitol/chloroaromatic compound transport system permease small subunit